MNITLETAKPRPGDSVGMKRTWQLSHVAGRVGTYAILLFLTGTTLLPLLWMVLTSVKNPQEVFTTFLPKTLDFTNYYRVWIFMNFPQALLNTVFVTAMTLSIVLLGATWGGYAFARLKFPGRDQIFLVYLSAMMIPSQVILIPMFMFLKRLGLLNSLPGLSLSYLGMAMPFTMFLMRGFFKTLPGELADAARIDGCGEMGTFWRIYLPLARPGIATITIFQFMNTWNEFMYATTFISKPALKTLQPAIYQAVGRYYTDWSALTAGMTMAIIPILIVYLVLQGQFIAGLTAGAIKG